MAFVFDDSDSKDNTVNTWMKETPPPPNRTCSWLSNICDYVNYDDKGVLTNKQYNDACHARANNKTHYGGYEARYTHCFFNVRHPATDELLPHYIDWLVNEGPFAKVFVSKNPQRIMTEGSVVDWSVHKGLAFGACIATRATWEHGQHMLLWWELVKAGVDRTYAYLVALGHHPLCDTGRPSREGTSVITHVQYGSVSHGGVDPLDWSKKAIDLWFTGKTKEGSKTERKADGTYRECSGDGAFKALFPLPQAVSESSGRFAAAAQGKCKLPDWIDHHVNTHQQFLSQYDKKSGGVVIEPIKKVGNGHEPMEDM